MLLEFDDVEFTVQKYVDDIRKKQIEREKAWEICYSQFRFARQLGLHDYNYLSLHLSSYLACWGMFRNSFLLNTNYTIHIEAVKLIMRHDYDCLCGVKCSECAGVIEVLGNLICELRDIYTNVRNDAYDLEGKQLPESEVSDILVSKVLLGTLACVPAFDQYCVRGMAKENVSPIKLGVESIESIVRFFENVSFDDLDISFVDNSIEIPYPQMKIVDMYFFQNGQKSS